MYQLDEKIWFWALGIIPVIILLFLVLQFWRYKAQSNFADKKLLKRLSPNRSVFKGALKVVILCLAFFLFNACLSKSKNWY
jgi:Ca-activated chloride channel family protein